MPPLSLSTVLVLVLMSTTSASAAIDVTLASDDDLEQRLRHIDRELDQLAIFSLRGGIGSIGFHSTKENDSEWVRVDLGTSHLIDQVIVVPTVRRDQNRGFSADGFPLTVKILVGDDGDPNGRIVAEHRYPSEESIGIAPLVLDFPPTRASWVHLEATELTRRAHSGRRTLTLSELHVFSGLENVALRQPVTSSSNETGLANSWDRPYLVDGHTPYLMNAAGGNPSVAYLSGAGDKPMLVVDLGSPYPLSRIHLHVVEQGDTVPQAYRGDLGFPRHLLIEGSHTADFIDPIPLLEYRPEFRTLPGPIMMWRIPETTCRFVRVRNVEPMDRADRGIEQSQIGFSEIELFARGENVARGKAFVAVPECPSERSLTALTDGNNFFGPILPTREWLGQLARRHQLELERPLIQAEIDRRYVHQNQRLEHMTQLAVLLALGMVISVILGRYVRMRQATRIRERIAADLHDELGADLHTIGLYSDLAMDSLDSKSELVESLTRIREFTEKSGKAARDCTNILEAKGVCENLIEDMKDLSRRLLTDLHHEMESEGIELLKKLKTQVRIDLFLFYKECLTNIVRHSGATEVTTRITASEQITILEVSDNGKGLDQSYPEGIPHSLKRRARLMRAKINVTSNAARGMNIILRIKRRPFFV